MKMGMKVVVTTGPRRQLEIRLQIRQMSGIEKAKETNHLKLESVPVCINEIELSHSGFVDTHVCIPGIDRAMRGATIAADRCRRERGESRRSL